VTLPISLGVAALALLLGVNGVWLAGRLFWHRQRSTFWLASSTILGCVAYLVMTGMAEDIARRLWPVAFDPVKGREIILRDQCEQPRSLGVMVMVAPIAVVIGSVLLLKYRDRPVLVSITVALFSAFTLLLFASPIPEKLARLALPEHVLRVPSHCGGAA